MTSHIDDLKACLTWGGYVVRSLNGEVSIFIGKRPERGETAISGILSVSAAAGVLAQAHELGVPILDHLEARERDLIAVAVSGPMPAYGLDRIPDEGMLHALSYAPLWWYALRCQEAGSRVYNITFPPFLSPEQLAITATATEALHRVVEAYKKGGITKEKFSMMNWSLEVDCGTVRCIGGWAEYLSPNSVNIQVEAHHCEGLIKLCWPSWLGRKETPPLWRCIAATDSFLRFGDPRWEEHLPERDLEKAENAG